MKVSAFTMAVVVVFCVTLLGGRLAAAPGVALLPVVAVTMTAAFLTVLLMLMVLLGRYD